MRRLVLAVALAIAATPASADQIGADAEAAAQCVDKKAGPEGDLPSSGPLRDRFLAEMGDPQDCKDVVSKPCRAAGGEQEACVARESRAWLRAVANVATSTSDKKGAAIWKAASARLQSHAVSLCEATAAMSAWGRETVKTKGRWGMSLSSPCVQEIIARDAIKMLVDVRGN